MKVRVDRDICYLYFFPTMRDKFSAHELDLPRDKIAWIKRADKEYWKAQAYLEDMVDNLVEKSK